MRTIVNGHFGKDRDGLLDFGEFALAVLAIETKDSRERLVWTFDRIFDQVRFLKISHLRQCLQLFFYRRALPILMRGRGKRWPRSWFSKVSLNTSWKVSLKRCWPVFSRWSWSPLPAVEDRLGEHSLSAAILIVTCVACVLLPYFYICGCRYLMIGFQPMMQWWAMTISLNLCL